MNGNHMPRKNRKNAASAPVVSPVVDAPVPPPPARAMFGARHSTLPTAMPPALSHLLPLLCVPPDHTRRNECTRFFARTLPGLTADDAPSLILTAARLLVTAGATINAPALPLDAIDPLVSYYYANRERHSADQNVSDLDRVAFSTRAAEMLLSNADAVCGRTARRVFNGGYNGTDPTATRRDSVASAVASLM